LTNTNARSRIRTHDEPDGEADDMVRRKQVNPDQRVLIPAMALPPTKKPKPFDRCIVFTFMGVTYVRHCRSQVYLDALLKHVAMFAPDVRERAPDTGPQAEKDDPLERRSVPR